MKTPVLKRPVEIGNSRDLPMTIGILSGFFFGYDYTMAFILWLALNVKASYSEKPLLWVELGFAIGLLYWMRRAYF